MPLLLDRAKDQFYSYSYFCFKRNLKQGILEYDSISGKNLFT